MEIYSKKIEETFKEIKKEFICQKLVEICCKIFFNFKENFNRSSKKIVSKILKKFGKNLRKSMKFWETYLNFVINYK